jgi:hypothetical protein
MQVPLHVENGPGRPEGRGQAPTVRPSKAVSMAKYTQLTNASRAFLRHIDRSDQRHVICQSQYKSVIRLNLGFYWRAMRI